MADNSENKVLFLDKNEDCRNIYGSFLDNENDLEVYVAEALEEVENNDYDVVVTDYIGEKTQEVWEKWDDVLIYTANEYDILDIPEEVEYIQKGRGFRELRNKVTEKIENYKVSAK